MRFTFSTHNPYDKSVGAVREIRGEIASLIGEEEVLRFFPRSTSMTRINVKHTVQKIKNDVKEAIQYINREWFGAGGNKGGVLLREGVFWAAFLEYIFPWCIDILKVFIALKCIQALFEEKGGGGRDGGGKGVFPTFLHYVRLYIFLILIPWGVDLVQDIGDKMRMELPSHKASVVPK